MSLEWLPQVCRVEKVEKHPNADALSIVWTTAGDYAIVTRIEQYQVGDLAIFVPCDTLVPDTEQFHFLSPLQYENYEEGGEVKKRVLGYKYQVGQVPERYRVIKAKKIRDIYSQSMLIPIIESLNDSIFIGTNVAEIFGFTKREEEEEDNIPSENGKRSQNEHAPHGWSIPYYDIASVRKFVDIFQPDEEIVLLEKDHGCNFAACFDGDKLWVKSRNFFKRTEIKVTNSEGAEEIVPATDLWNEAARACSLADRLKAFPMKVFFAELVGAVKGFRYDSEVIDGKFVPKLHFFDVYDPVIQRYLNYDDSLVMIQAAGLTPSKELYRGIWQEKEKMYAYAEGKSAWNAKHCREGWVMKPTTERYEPRLKGRFQLKFVSEIYNLQK